MQKFTVLPLPVWRSAAPVSLAFAADVVETIVARINSEIITLGELNKQREQLHQELQQRLTWDGPHQRVHAPGKRPAARSQR